MTGTTAGIASLKHPKFAPLTLDFFCLNQDSQDSRINRNYRRQRRIITRFRLVVKRVDVNGLIGYYSKNNPGNPLIRRILVQTMCEDASGARFNKTEKECRSDLDRMLFVFKNAQNLGKVPPSFNKMVFKRIFEIARISNFTIEELMSYERENKRYSDHINALAYAKKQGVMQTAKNMLAKGYSIAEVIGITNLPREQVMALR